MNAMVTKSPTANRPCSFHYSETRVKNCTIIERLKIKLRVLCKQRNRNQNAILACCHDTILTSTVNANLNLNRNQSSNPHRLTAARQTHVVPIARRVKTFTPVFVLSVVHCSLTRFMVWRVHYIEVKP